MFYSFLFYFYAKLLDMQTPYQDISFVKQCKFFTLFLFISLNLKCLLDTSSYNLFYEVLYNGIFSILFGVVFYLALIFLQYLKKNVLNDTFFKDDLLSFFIQQVVTVFVFFAITGFFLDKIFVSIAALIPFVNTFQGGHYLAGKFTIVAIILFNYFIILNYLRFIMDKRGIHLDCSSLSGGSTTKSKESYVNNKLSIYGLNKNEVVHMDSKDFIFAKSDGHYMKIYFFAERNNIGNKRVRSILVRNSLKKMITEVFADFDHIARVHKSYIINYSYVKKVRNLPNNKGGVIDMSFVDIKIPIGFTKIENVNTYLLMNNLDVPIYS